MAVKLFDYQEKAVSKLRTGSILRGGVGSGKTITALAYYYTVECGGSIEDGLTPMTKPKDLYVITIANKRDSLDWEKEAACFGVSNNRSSSINGVKLTVDSWNNIAKYKEVEGAFFIFDEQKLVGSGAWVKAFLKIVKSNNWILLTATPGDVWSDYIPVFIANGFYKNRTEFMRTHVVYNPFTSFPKIDRYERVGTLQKYKDKVLVEMNYKKKTENKVVKIMVDHDENVFNEIFENRWNPFLDQPIKGASEACYAMRRVVNSNPGRLKAILTLLKRHPKLIIFYNFDYELEILRGLKKTLNIPIAEYNGHFHEPVPKGESWVYLAQYMSAGEAWNCIETDAMVMYSRNYSYRQTIQAMGRIDRQNTPFPILYYYFLTSNSPIDRGIEKTFVAKKNFNETKFVSY